MSNTPMWRRYGRFTGPDVRADLEEELRFHLEMRAEDLMARGMDEAGARREAERRLGDLRKLGEECMAIGERTEREHRRRERWEVARMEMRSAVRALLRSPGFTALTVLTLGLGIGATSAIFAMLDAVVLRPLPFADSERLVNIGNRVPERGPDERWGVSPAGYFYFRENSRTLEDIGIYTLGRSSVAGDGPAERVNVAAISSSLFTVLRARPALGRLITAEDDVPAVTNGDAVAPGPAEQVTLLSHEFWMRRYGGDPKIVGSSIRLGGREIPVVGVLPEGFQLPDQKVDVWTALGLNPNARATNWHTFTAIGRLRDGAAPETAERELSAFTSRFPEIFPSAYSAGFMEDTGFSPDVVRWQQLVVGDLGRTLWILLGAVALVLLIACANVANLFLVRAEGRHREMAIRAALGATSGRLARLFLAEGLASAMLGGVLGVFLAYAGMRVLVARAPEGLPRLGEIGITPSVLLFVIGISLLVGLIVGLFPLLRTGGGYSPRVLREAGRGATSGRDRTGARNLLVVGQIAMALVLLAAAGLLLQSFQRLRSVDAGFDAENVLALEVNLPSGRYRSYSEVAAFHEELLRRIESLPGVASAGVASSIPLVGSLGCASVFAEDRADLEGERAPCVPVALATPGYHEALSIGIEGRSVRWSDVHQGTGAVLVSRALADRLWPGEDPVGKGIRGNGYGKPYYRVVGVTENVRYEGLDQPHAEIVYFPPVPLEGAGLWGPLGSANLVVRTAGSRPESIAPAIRGIVSELDPEVPIANVRSMEQVLARSMSRVSFAMMLLGVAAAVALALGAIGLYGVLSYVVRQRTTELGIRLALGATGRQIARLVMGRAIVLSGIGVFVGLGVAVAVTRVLRSLLFEVDATNPVVLGGVALLLMVVALAASYLPTRRAMRVDPMISLRAD